VTSSHKRERTDELAGSMQKKLAEYAALSQSLDRTFPSRLLKTDSKHLDTSIEELKVELTELEDKRKQLIEAGFIEAEGGLDIEEITDIDESNRNFLQLYIEDVKQKLSVFNDLTRIQ
jgi:RecA/RadA recombinase